jgi:glycerophosphoryl diester phosphodiesterase
MCHASQARRHSLRVSMLHRHNQTELERQVLRSSFDVRVLTQAQTAYAAASSVLCGVLALGKRGIPLTLIEPFVAHFYPSKLLQTLFQSWSRLMHPASRRVVQSPDATSSAYFTVSHQNGLSISIQSARNLDLVCISYLYERPVFSVLHAFFWVLQGWVATGGAVRL